MLPPRSRAVEKEGRGWASPLSIVSQPIPPALQKTTAEKIFYR